MINLCFAKIVVLPAYRGTFIHERQDLLLDASFVLLGYQMALLARLLYFYCVIFKPRKWTKGILHVSIQKTAMWCAAAIWKSFPNYQNILVILHKVRFIEMCIT